jgi:hypothetical protein
MFANDLEKELMKSLMNYFDKYYDKLVVIEWADGTKIKALLDTFYETDNGLELDEEGYEEYYACAITVKEIINLPEKLYKSLIYPEKEEIDIGVGSEISYHNIPKRVCSINGEIIWNMDN